MTDALARVQEVMTEELSLGTIREAAKRLKGLIRETPLIPSPVFSQESGNTVWLKPENLQLTGAYKVRGAYNKILSLTEDERKRGLIAASAGNHAQGVALAAAQLGVPATIVMPCTTPLIKVEATRSYGANVVLHGNMYDDACKEAYRLEQTKGLVFVHPFDDPAVMAGQGTIGLEIFEELPEVDAVLVPVGGGGLISGIAVALKTLNPRIRVIGVEPEGAMAMKKSFAAGRRVTLDHVDTIADGVAVKVPGALTYEIARHWVDEIITVNDYDLMDAMLQLLEKHKLIAENAGVLSLAGLNKLNCTGKNIVSVISGGNIDVVTISSMINKGLVIRGRIFSFAVDLPDTPGQLVRVSEILAKHSANVIKLDHNQFSVLDRFHNVTLKVTIEANGHRHIEEITRAMAEEGYGIRAV